LRSVEITDKYGRYVRLQNIDTRMVDGSLRGYEFEALIERTSSSSLRPPGMASLAPVLSHALSIAEGVVEGSGLAMAAPPHHLQTMGERVGILPTRGDWMASGLLSPEPVEFVIVLELKTGAP
jgi:hypothetical protein